MFAVGNEGDPNLRDMLIHEVGHATYEQAVDPAYLLTPIGRGASMGVHESQSRIYENQIARSEAYTAHLLSYVDAQKLKPLKIVANAGNGGAGLAMNGGASAFSSSTRPARSRPRRRCRAPPPTPRRASTPWP